MMAACIRHWPSESARRWFEYLIRECGIDETILAVVVVGSAVREIQDPADLDLLVIHRGNKPSVRNPPLDVDVRYFSEGEVNRKLEEGHELLGWAVELGCAAHDPRGYWKRTVDRWRGRVPLPSEDRALERAAEAQAYYEHFSSVGDRDAAREQHLTMLTHLARARLLERKVLPASRPELATQLRSIGQHPLAKRLTTALEDRKRVAA